MKNRKKLIYLLFININLFSYTFSYLIFPFKTKKSILEDTEHNITRLFRSLLYNNIYINLEIGEPKQNVEAFLASKYIYFYFSEKTKNNPRTNTSNPDFDDVGCELDNFFDKNKSESIEITNIKARDLYGIKGNASYDYFYLKNEKNEIIKDKLKFFLYESTIGNRPAVVGLQFPRVKEEFNLFTILKEKDLITSFNWMVNYTSEDEGNFIIGELLHKIDPQNYKEENLLTGHPYTYKAMQEIWGLRMDDILFNGRNFRPYHECYFYYELNYIEGIDNLEKELDKYFNDSINNGTCFKKYIVYPYSPHKFYYCEKEKYKENMKYFPPIKFIHKEMNYTFELTYEDLFIEKYDKLILLIFFSDNGSSWKFGKPFLKKYNFIMNQDHKIVSFYKNHGYQNNDKGNKEDGNNKNNYILIFTLTGIVMIILIFLGIFIGKYVFKKKKRINTLDDDYDYTRKNDDEKNDENLIN